MGEEFVSKAAEKLNLKGKSLEEYVNHLQKFYEMDSSDKRKLGRQVIPVWRTA